MPKHVQSFFSGVIIQSLVTAFIIGMVSLLYNETIHDIKQNAEKSTKAHEATIKLNSEMPRLTEAITLLGEKLEGLIKHQAEHEKAVPAYKVWKTKVDIKLDDHYSKLNNHQLGLEMIEMKCNTNERGIEKCREKLLKD